MNFSNELTINGTTLWTRTNPKSGPASSTQTGICRRRGTGPETSVRKCTFGKGDLYREIPMSASFIERMREMRAAATTPYVIEYEGRPIKKIRRSLPTAVRNAGITYPVCLYSIRHLFATVTLSMGADLAAVSKILGHCSTKMTADTYYHLLEGEKVRAVGLIPQIGV